MLPAAPVRIKRLEKQMVINAGQVAIMNAALDKLLARLREVQEWIAAQTRHPNKSILPQGKKYLTSEQRKARLKKGGAI
jgi:hypothetical protein